MAKIRITKAPSGKAKVRIKSGPSSWFNQIAPSTLPDHMSAPEFSTRRTLPKVPRDQANIEAESGESVYMPDKGGLPAHYNVDGNRHSNGGTPLNVPKDSFVFSDTKKMRIKDPNILKFFGKSEGAYTPADLAKKYDINKFRKILQDPDSDDIMRDTAEKMIANYNLKLGKLALVQESKKGFPQGIPTVAMPYMMTYNISPDQVLPLKSQTEDTSYEEIPQAKWGRQVARDGWENNGKVDPFGWFSWMDRQLKGTPKSLPKPKAELRGAPPLSLNYPGWIQNPDGSWTQTATPSKTSQKLAEQFAKKERPVPSAQPAVSWDSLKALPYQQQVDTLRQIKDTNPSLFAELKRQKEASHKYGGLVKYAQGGSNSRDPFAEVEKIAKPVSKAESKVLQKAAATDQSVADFGITMHLGDKTESIDVKTGKKSKNWNKARISTNNQELNRLATILGFNPNDPATFDPSKGADTPVNEKFQRFLYTHPDPKFKEVIDKFHSKESGYGTPQFSQKMFDSFLGTRWLDAISEIRSKPEVKEVVEVPAEERGTVDRTRIQPREAATYTQAPRNAPWWLQDVINTASAAGTRLGLKKYLPWAPPVHLETPRPTFLDPTRELAANAEAAVIGTEGAAMFAGPQAYSARAAGIQGQSAKNAANILSRYHNQNVGLANQFENLRTNIMNKEGMMNAESARRLYDQTTVANQQFDNAKRQAMNELRESYVNAITNRAQTQTMNLLYPHFQVDPSTGGMLGFYKGSEMLPGEREAEADKLQELMSRGISEEAALELLGYGSDRRGKQTQSQGQDIAFNPYINMMQRMGNPAFSYGYQPQYYDEEG